MSNKDDDFADAFSTVTPSAATGVEEGVTYDDFFSIMNKSGNCYLYVPCRDFWPARSVNARLPPKQVLNKNGTPKHGPNGKLVYEPASKWLDRNRPIEAMTWAPGFPMQIRDRLIAHGGWIERKGVSCFNLYRPPRASSLAIPAKPDSGVTTSVGFIPTTRATSLSGSRIGCSAQEKRSTTRFAFLVRRASERIRY